MYRYTSPSLVLTSNGRIIFKNYPENPKIWL